MAILGNNVKGAASSSLAVGRQYASKFTLASGGTMTELHGWFGGSSTAGVRVVIYADSAGSPGARIAYTNPLAAPAGSDVDLSQTGFSVALAAGSYWIGFLALGTGGVCYAADPGGEHKGRISGATDPPADPFPSTDTTGTRNHSVWAVVSAGSPPVNTVAPAVTGTAVSGQTLTCSTGTWSNTPTGYTYQWKRGGTNISGATASTYTLVSADKGTSVKCTVTAANAAGSASTDSNAVTVSSTLDALPDAGDVLIRTSTGWITLN